MLRDLDLWPFDPKMNELPGFMVEYFCLKFGDRSFIGFLDIVRKKRQTDRQTRVITIPPRLSSTWVRPTRGDFNLTFWLGESWGKNLRRVGISSLPSLPLATPWCHRYTPPSLCSAASSRNDRSCSYWVISTEKPWPGHLARQVCRPADISDWCAMLVGGRWTLVITSYIYIVIPLSRWVTREAEGEATPRVVMFRLSIDII